MSNSIANLKKLSDLEIGEVAIIQGINTLHKELRVKLQTFGLLSGTALEVKSVAPLGDPITISVRGSSLSLRKNEADAVSVYVNTPLRDVTDNILGLVSNP